MSNVFSERRSSYLDYLPAVFEAADDDGTLNALLAAFEEASTGAGAMTVDVGGDAVGVGLEEILDGIADAVTGDIRLAGVQRFFDAGPARPPALRAPDRFLEWLSQWVAIVLRADLDIERQRSFIARAVSLYGARGTKAGLQALVGVYTASEVTITDFATPFQIGAHSTVGTDALIGGGAPHYFEVVVRLPRVDQEQMREQSRIVSAIIDAEKPAHTHYKLIVQTPTLRIAVTSTVGVDTLIGIPEDESS